MKSHEEIIESIEFNEKPLKELIGNNNELYDLFKFAINIGLKEGYNAALDDAIKNANIKISDIFGWLDPNDYDIEIDKQSILKLKK